MERLQAAIAVPGDFEQPHLDYGLYLLQNLFRDSGKNLVEDYHLPVPQLNWQCFAHVNPLIAAELDYDWNIEAAFDTQKVAQFKDEQCIAYNSILKVIATDSIKTQFFLQGPAGTVKTFFYQCLCHYF